MVRPGNQRHKKIPEPFVFPAAQAPDIRNAQRAALRLYPTDDEDDRATVITETPTITKTVQKPTFNAAGHPIAKEEPIVSSQKPKLHRRAHSFSTSDGRSTIRNDEPGTFKVVIGRPSAKRPSTAETGLLQMLQVPIPSYRLGTPQFTTRGTAVLRSSVYTRTTEADDTRSSVFSYASIDPDRLQLRPPPATHSSYISRAHSEAYPRPQIQHRTTLLASPSQGSARTSTEPIGPHLYDALTKHPDDPTIVRFNDVGDIVAATPSRLIAHITSPSFLDYELLSDFFLTFRSFLSTSDLVSYLIARLRWAVSRTDDFGRIVRVRTFVALRHWVLNYFVDDFVPDYQLRDYFCNLVNSLYKELSRRHDGGAGDLKIIGELKKCWRRTCALYWDPKTLGMDSPDVDILPGGANESVYSLDSFLATQQLTPMKAIARKRKNGENPNLHSGDPFTNKHIEHFREPRHIPQQSATSAPISSMDQYVPPPQSPSSELSAQIKSCSLPVRAPTRGDNDTNIPLCPRPVPANAGALPITSSRPAHAHAHKRSGSFSDALRDSRASLPLPKATEQDVQAPQAARVPGTLVRGAVYHPGSPYVQLNSTSNTASKSHLELNTAEINAAYAAGRTAPGQSQSVKRIFGSMRRALSGRQPPANTFSSAGDTDQPSQHSLQRLPTPLSSGSASTSAGIAKKKSRQSKEPARIDRLAAKVSERFKQALEAELELERQGRHSMLIANIGRTARYAIPAGEHNVRTKGHNTAVQAPEPTRDDTADSKYHSAITPGSRSIVIFDDTNAPPVPMMSGALPVQDAIDKAVGTNFSRPFSSPQTEEHPDVEMHPGIGDSSAALTRGGHSHIDSALFHQAPLSAPITEKPSTGSYIPRRTVSVAESSRSRPPMHRRHTSARSNSTSLRRYASYHSTLNRSHRAPSDGYSVSDNDLRLPEKGPARQLRRRPGGDLRAVDNVHDLEPMPRPKSAGSLSSRTQSAALSVLTTPLDGTPSKPRPKRSAPNSGPLPASSADKELPRRRLSLIDTHSSQPNMRASFEAEVKKLAALPDDHENDGGVEAALMKLEGRFEKRSPDSGPVPSPRETNERHEYEIGNGAIPTDDGEPGPTIVEEDSSASNSTASPPHDNDDDTRSFPDVPDRLPISLPATSYSYVGSESSYNSVPLLERGLSGVMTSKVRYSSFRVDRPSAEVPPLNALPAGYPPGKSSRTALSPESSIEYVEETDSVKELGKRTLSPKSPSKPAPNHESFLLDDNQDLSDFEDDNGDNESGVFIDSVYDGSHGVRSLSSEDPSDVNEAPKEEVMPHPLRHPPTPPLTTETDVQKQPSPPPPPPPPPQSANPPASTEFKKGLPTPVLTPPPSKNPQELLVELGLLKAPLKEPSAKPKKPLHTPFFMAFDPELVAKQFTIIEKDALDEIDWKELIELRWKQSSPAIMDWVEYLRTQKPHGVDVVIARFNLVVKWAVSEVVLTTRIEERARCISRYIQVAKHTRRMHNYATMYQLTIALLSTDCTRLTRTWDLVPLADREALREMEMLVQPLRNFHSLRVEMETAPIEEGCIPFIGKSQFFH